MGSYKISDISTEQTTPVETDLYEIENAAGTSKKITLKTIFKSINIFSSKASVVSADELVINDSADSWNPKKVTVGAFGLVPSGVALPYVASGAAPSGFLLCDGTSYLRASYAGLFAVIGTTYGSVDGSHFNVPDFRGDVLRGYESGVSEAIGTEQDDAMQRITGTFGEWYVNVGPLRTDSTISTSGVFSEGAAKNDGPSGNGGAGAALDFDSADSTSPNTAKTDDVETRMRNYAVQWIIKT
jgi:microcystin-dependent protein